MGSSFYLSAFKSLRHKSANMDVLVVLGTTAAWAYGIALIFVGYNSHDMMDENMYRMQI
jgi:Cu+-exporting ATPase